MRKLNIAILTLLLALFAAPGAASAADSGVLAVTPETVLIGAAYDGAVLHVEGEVPAGSDVVLRFAGGSKDLRMKVKGRALGFLWMNLDELVLHGAPSVMLVDSSRSLDEIGAAADPYRLKRTLQDIGITPADKDNAQYRSEFLKLKSKTGLYGEASGGVKLGPADGGIQRFSADLRLPSGLPVGEYKLEALALRDGRVAASAVRDVPVRFTGIPAKLADVAFNHALLYGILATVVALLGGLAIGLVFQRKSAH